MILSKSFIDIDVSVAASIATSTECSNDWAAVELDPMRPLWMLSIYRVLTDHDMIDDMIIIVVMMVMMMMMIVKVMMMMMMIIIIMIIMVMIIPNDDDDDDDHRW